MTLIQSSQYGFLMVSNRRTRNSNSDNGILLNVPKSKTVSFQNSFYVRAPTFGTFYPISSETLQDLQLPLKVYYLDTTLTFSNTSTNQTILEHLNRCASNATLLVLFKIYLSDHDVDSLAKAN
jgi:hypothetical protein